MVEEIRRQRNTNNDNLLRDQLLQCAETSLKKTLQNTIGATKMATIAVANLMLEIEKADVENQFDLLNKVKFMEAKQERDEPIRTFIARLRGLANICVLYTQCADAHRWSPTWCPSSSWP